MSGARAARKPAIMGVTGAARSAPFAQSSHLDGKGPTAAGARDLAALAYAATTFGSLRWYTPRVSTISLAYCWTSA